MGFVVEDGSGSNPLANSYTTVEFADEYFADRAIGEWTGAESAKESALILATDYIDKRFSFIGCPISEDQPLKWPRSGTGKATDSIPIEVQKATVEYALRALAAPLAPDPVSDETGRSVTGTRSKVGPIEEEVTYTEGSVQRIYKNYPAADAYLRGLVVTGGRAIR